MTAAISWAGPLAHTGRHRLTWKQRLIRWNERTAEELCRAQPKEQAGKAARNAAAWVPCAGVVVWLYSPSLWIPVTLTTAFIWGVAAIAGGLW